MYEIIKYYIIFARFIYFKLRRIVDFNIAGRVFEGIAIGIYATVIDKFVDNGINIDLTIKSTIAIIMTYTGILMQKKGKK